MTDTTQKIITLYQNGHSLAKIAKIIHLSLTTISRTLRDNYITIRPRGWTQRKYDVTEDYYYDSCSGWNLRLVNMSFIRLLCAK
jgi:hypothetical protein